MWWRKLFLFSWKQKQLENEALNVMQMGTMKKSTPPMNLGRTTDSLPCLLYSDLGPAMVLVTLAKLLKADPVLHQWVAFLDKKGNRRERQRTQVCSLRQISVKKPEEDKRCANEVGPSWPFGVFGFELPIPKSHPRVWVKLKLYLPLPSQIHANYACRFCRGG